VFKALVRIAPGVPNVRPSAAARVGEIVTARPRFAPVGD
jgi:hypothetical protein